MASTVSRPQTSTTVPGVSQNENANVTALAASPSGLVTSRPGQSKPFTVFSSVPKPVPPESSNRNCSTGSTSLAMREDGDDDDVRRERLEPLAAGVGLLVAQAHAALQRRVVALGAGHGGRRAGVGVGQQRLARRPHAQEADQHAGGEQRGDDVGQLDRDVVRAEELREGERDAGHQRRGPGLAHAAAAVDHADQDQRHDQRQERGLQADHGRPGRPPGSRSAPTGSRSAWRSSRRPPARCCRSATAPPP